MEAYVVGGGPSLYNFDFEQLRNKYTVVTNKAIFDVPNPNVFVTIDYTFLGKIPLDKLQQIKCPKVFIANLCPDYMQEKEGRIVDTRFAKIYDLSLFDIIIKSRTSTGMGITLDDFRHGANSGFCGLQLAVLFGFKAINLLGIDLVINKDRTHYHGGYGEDSTRFSGKLPNYIQAFKEGVQELKEKDPEVQLCSMSATSSLNTLIPYRKEGVNEEGSATQRHFR